MIEIPVLEDGDLEVRKEAQIYVSTLQSNVLDDLISYYSCWWNLKCAITWLLHYKQYPQVKVQLRKNAAIVSDSTVKSSEMPLMKCGYLTVAEVHVAEMAILRHIQEVAEVVGWSINMSAESTAKGRLTSKCPHWLREETPCYHPLQS